MKCDFMKSMFIKPYRWAAVFSVLLTVSFVMVLLDTFVIPKAYEQVIPDIGTHEKENQETDQIKLLERKNYENAVQQGTQPTITDTYYKDGNIEISIETVYKYNTKIYIADVQIADPSYLKTALAGNIYGRNIKDTTSNMAKACNAILAINGDYYGFRDTGFVLRNGVLYRSIAREYGDDQALIIDKEGNFKIIHESQTDIEELNTDNIWQIFCFGPALVENGEIVVDKTTEVSKAKNSNPRTAIGQISRLHYVFIVSDGRTSESRGLSLYELAQELKERGCVTAYNLDGGGSSTMYFNGRVINNPTDGRKSGERKVSDIVYIGY